MPRPRRPENVGLPARWAWKHGAIYYQVPTKQRAAFNGRAWFLLGHSLPEAFKTYGERIGAEAIRVRTIGQLLDRYALEVVPTKRPATRRANAYALQRLRPVFADVPLADLKPQHAYRYVDERKRKHSAAVAPHREIEVLSHALTKAVEWGLIDRNPLLGQLRFKGETPRTRYVEDWEIVECLALPTKRKRGSVLAIQAHIRLKLLTGMRQRDILSIREAAPVNLDRGQPYAFLSETGLHVKASKTGKETIYAWTDELRRAVADARAARTIPLAPWLFCNRRGECYVNFDKGTAAGFKSMWQRFMARVLRETQVTEPFTEHDIRAKVGSDAENLERARQLLAHVDARTTDRIYRRKPEIVRPAR